MNEKKKTKKVEKEWQQNKIITKKQKNANKKAIFWM